MLVGPLVPFGLGVIARIGVARAGCPGGPVIRGHSLCYLAVGMSLLAWLLLAWSWDRWF